jgi:hypothetical protein
VRGVVEQTVQQLGAQQITGSMVHDACGPLESINDNHVRQLLPRVTDCDVTAADLCKVRCCCWHTGFCWLLLASCCRAMVPCQAALPRVSQARGGMPGLTSLIPGLWPPVGDAAMLVQGMPLPIAAQVHQPHEASAHASAACSAPSSLHCCLSRWCWTARTR